jgi:2-polyprenyl-3-methyl-5-hydroxy-6-metoxy-1,4-benzoquinol methylase
MVNNPDLEINIGGAHARKKFVEGLTHARGYWDRRYKQGGTSGSGSKGKEREWRWNVIQEYIQNINEVVDVGCGDLSFWEGKTCDDYTGIDISEKIIIKNRMKRPDWDFIIASADEFIEGLMKECVFCIGVLFHVMDDEIYKHIIINLCKYSKKYIVVYSWITNPFNRTNSLRRFVTNLFSLKLRAMLISLKYIVSPTVTDGVYQYFRPFEKSFQIFSEYGFDLIGKRITPDRIGAFYIFANASAPPGSHSRV